MILVSACLAGINCKYDGENNYNNDIARLVMDGKAIPVCPEQLGGCSTPRVPAEITGGTSADVLDGAAYVKRSNNVDVTKEFIQGAREVLKIVKLIGINEVIFKSKSPSCGCGLIYDGTFTGKLIKGNGVTTELLIRNGVKVKNENQI